MIKLIFPNGEHAAIELGDGLHVIGKAAESKVVVLGPSIAPKHAELLIQGETVKLRPVVTDHAVQLNGVRLLNSTVIKPGDLIQIGDVRARIVAVDRASTAQVAVKKHEEDDGRTKIRGALPKFLLRGVSGPTFGKVFPIVGQTVIGRQPDCDIAVTTDELSRRHCELRPTADGLWVEDLGSSNGTYINDKRITRDLLRPGDELRLDTLRFQMIAPGMEPAGMAKAHDAIAATEKATQSQVGLSPLVWAILAVAVASVVALALKVGGVF